MSTALRVSLSPALKHGPLPAGRTALAAEGPLLAIGGAIGEDGLTEPVKPDEHSLFGPRGACLASAEGPLFVNDTGHHRLMGWAHLPHDDGTPADWVIGQRDFWHEGRNGKGDVGAATLNVPTGISCCGRGLAVADAWNHRVLIWHDQPRASHVPCDVVLGQRDFTGGEANRGSAQADSSSLFWPYGLHWDGERLWVSDTGNRRVLMWLGLPQHNGQSADLVLGQRDFDCRDENGGGAPTGASMRWPHGIATWRGRLCVADAGNNRIMVWDHVPGANNRACDHVLGQKDATLVDHNQSLYWPNAASLNMPYGVTAAGDWLLAADTANSRVTAWRLHDCVTGADALALSGQPDFHAKGDNRWQLPARDSLCWPYAVAHEGRRVVVSDSGNNRVLVWNTSDDLDEVAA